MSFPPSPTLGSLFSAMSNSEPLTIVFPLYPGVTQLDFTGPYQFLVRLPGVKPIVASVEDKPVDPRRPEFLWVSSLGTNRALRCALRSWRPWLHRRYPRSALSICDPVVGRDCSLYHFGLHRLADSRGSRSSGRKTRSVSLGLAGILASLRRHSRCRAE